MRVQPMAVCALRDLSATLGGDFANNFALPRIVSFGRDSSVYRIAPHRRIAEHSKQLTTHIQSDNMHCSPPEY
jgi:hypothetical protein